MALGNSFLLALQLAKIFVSAFLAILFLQSAIDKMVDRRGNLEWLSGHFAKSPLAGMVPLLLTVITLIELGAGGCSAVGCVMTMFMHNSSVAFWGAVLSCLALLALFFGQRLAKDYAGAAVLVSYFLLALLALFLLSGMT